MINTPPFWFLVGLVAGIVVLRQLAYFILAPGRDREGAFARAMGGLPGAQWLSGRAVQAGQRYPGLRHALRRRVALDSFTGLPLSLLVVLGLLTLLLAGDLIQSLLHAGEIIEVDEGVHQGLSPLRGAPLISLFIFLTFYGTVPFMLGATGLISLLLVVFNRARYVLPFLFTIGGSTAVTWGGKHLVDRPRPPLVTQVIETSPSFPSGHATAAMALYGFLAYLCWREAPTPRLRFETAFWLTMMIGLMGLSRLVLGVHYLSDVAVGYLVGLFFLLIGVGLAEWQRRGTVSLHPHAPREPGGR